jgi:hypothetical protein
VFVLSRIYYYAIYYSLLPLPPPVATALTSFGLLCASATLAVAVVADIALAFIGMQVVLRFRNICWLRLTKRLR